MKSALLTTLFCLIIGFTFAQQQANVFEPIDVFDLEYAADPQISPDGKTVVYVRNFKDIMTDKNRSNLWMIDASGKNHRPLTTGMERDRSPRWSPDGTKLVYVSSKEESSQLYLRWMDNGMEARLSNLPSSPGGLSWSPDGKWIAFTMFVEGKSPSLVQMPKKPKGAKWNASPKYIEKMKFKADGSPSILPDGFRHVFILSTEGGTPRQITEGAYNYGSIAWSGDSKSILVSANLQKNWQYVPNDNEVHEIDVATGALKTLTSRIGPDNVVGYSPNGKKIAYTGFDDKYLGLQLSQIYIMDRDGKNVKSLTADLDRGVSNVIWSDDGRGLYFQYHDKGNSKVAYVDLNGTVSVLADDVGGLSIGRPYSGGEFSVSKNGVFAFTHSRPDHPADVAVGKRGGGEAQRITRLNADLFSHKQLGAVEEIWYKSSYDGKDIQGWICKPPNFDPSKKYPLILEIHGGPFTNYGDRFSAEVQLYAAAGYVVLYTNPRGSTLSLIHISEPTRPY